MNLPINPIIYKQCKIIPFENLQDVIIAINQSKYGTELQVRYFWNGEYRKEWFPDFDIDLLGLKGESNEAN